MVLHGSDVDRAAVPTAPRPRIATEISLGLATFALYVVVESTSGPARVVGAQQHGRQLLAVEQALRVPVEVWLNSWLTPHPRIRIVANYEYAFTYIVTALWLLVWLYRRRPEMYRWARTSFLLLNVIGVSAFALYPVAPPRLLTGTPFVDTVTRDGTFGSWGSPVVGHANQLAAMPSLHIAWAVWVSVVLARVSGRWWVQALAAVHISVTMFVIMATANHYLLDAVGGALLVWLTFGLMLVFWDRPGHPVGPRVAAADAFFLYVESPTAAQHVGGLVVLDARADGFHQRLRTTLETHLPELPRFSQKLSAPSSWRRPRWRPAGALDWDWHMPRYELNGGGQAALNDLVARLQTEPLPRDRPLWRFASVTGFTAGKVAVVFIVHHAVADGIGTIAQAATMMEPVPDLPTTPATGLGPVRRAVATAVGLAQLATDGPNRDRLPGQPDGQRGYATLSIPVRKVRAVARAYGVRVSDVLLCLAAGAVHRTLEAAPATLRTAVPLMMRTPDSTSHGNVTAAVMIDLPTDDRSEAERLQEIARRSTRLRTGTRALAARFVMASGCAALPPVLLAWFARTVYGRRFFQAIVSNMPGPVGERRLAGDRMERVYPVLPLAPGAPLAIGAIGWDGMLFLGVSVDPSLGVTAVRLAVAAREALADLTAARPDRVGAGSATRFIALDAARLRADSPAWSSAEVRPPRDDVAAADGREPLDTRASLDGLAPVDGLAPLDGLAPVDGRARVDGREPADGREPVDGREPAEGRLQARASTSRARSSGESNVDPYSRWS
jgi:PAP2 superfamily protein/wax ester synthase-like acyl-CoA acyltransferase family protein/uncharacterized protein DUF1298